MTHNNRANNLESNSEKLQQQNLQSEKKPALRNKESRENIISDERVIFNSCGYDQNLSLNTNNTNNAPSNNVPASVATSSTECIAPICEQTTKQQGLDEVKELDSNRNAEYDQK